MDLPKREIPRQQRRAGAGSAAVEGELVRAPLLRRVLTLALGLLAASPTGAAVQVLYEKFSPYHHIRVGDSGGLRVLYFDNTTQTQMAITNPLQGHFTYTEMFQLPRLWVRPMTEVCMIGLGGGSTQRAYAHYCPEVRVDTVELDRAVIEVARQFFFVTNGPKHRIINEDGRLYLRRATNRYDAILLDAYSGSRYGGCIPHHLATKEFFLLCKERLATNGVLAYNVIGESGGWGGKAVAAMHRTLGAVFPNVYGFKAPDSMNIVFLAVQAPKRANRDQIIAAARLVLQSSAAPHPTLALRAAALRESPPVGADTAPVLTDDFSPIEGFLDQSAGR